MDIGLNNRYWMQVVVKGSKIKENNDTFEILSVNGTSIRKRLMLGYAKIPVSVY